MGQLVDEADGVGHQHARPGSRGAAAARWCPASRTACRRRRPRCRSARASASTCRRWCSRPAPPGSCRGGGRAGSAAPRPARRARASARRSGRGSSGGPAPGSTRRRPCRRCRRAGGPSPCRASRSRGARYCRRTISTWALAARERAWRWKISRMTAVRSSTSTPVAFSRLRACDGVISWSTSTAVIDGSPHGSRDGSPCRLPDASPEASSGRSFAASSVFSSSSLPLPITVAVSSDCRFWMTVAAMVTPSVFPSRPSSATEAAKASSSASGSWTATRTARTGAGEESEIGIERGV